MRDRRYRLMTKEQLFCKAISTEEKKAVENAVGEATGIPAEPEEILKSQALRHFLYRLIIDGPEDADLLDKMGDYAAPYCDGWNACRHITSSPECLKALSRN
ncbi:MAG: hypothetical protein WC359_12440 [Dehalococcoidia bacterium]|jgi:hypothetical protein